MQNVPTLYLKGTFNGWGLDTPFVEQSPLIYMTHVVFSADKHQFKIADMDGSERWTLAAHATQSVALDLASSTALMSTQGIGNDLTFTPNKTGRFQLTLDLTNETPSLTIEPEMNTLSLPQRGDLVNYRITNTHSDPLHIHNHKWAMGAEALFDQLAIESKQTFPYVFGDNVDGYYEGQTHNFACAGRYRHHQGWYLGGFGSLIDGELNDRTKARHARLMPYGIEHRFAQGSDCLSLLQNKRMACLSVNATSATTLSIIPELNLAHGDFQIEHFADVLLIEVEPTLCPEGCPQFIAISANHAVTIKELNLAEHRDISDKMLLSPSNMTLSITSETPIDQLSVYLSFEHDKNLAIESARKAAQEDANTQHRQSVYDFLTHYYFWSDDIEYNRATLWARLSSRVFVSHEFGTGIWAGLPWFKDCWGRDTFIALSGTSLINGEFSEAKAIIENFASMQLQDETSLNDGRIPNRVTSKTNIIYNTTDGTPWMIREILEYINYSGDIEFAERIYPVVQRFIAGVERNYLDQDGLIKHRHPDTWMDAKIDGQIPWSPRGPKANDIQALWFDALHVAQTLAQLNQDDVYADYVVSLAQQAKQSFIDKFWCAERQSMADRLTDQDQPDLSVRPNQLMTLTIPQSKPLVDHEIGQYIVKNSVEQLLFPWGICSLNQSHEDFHPYHDNRSEYHKDAAYHNGTIWGWNAGFTVSSLNKFDQQDFAYQLSKNLAKQILEQGHRGSMSENLDAFQQDPNALIETGTYAQAWSVSEYARNTQQDYLGFKPQLIRNQIRLEPKLPAQWHQFVTRLPFGECNALEVTFERDNHIERYQISPVSQTEKVRLNLSLRSEHDTIEMVFALTTPFTIALDSQSGEVTCSLEPLSLTRHPLARYPVLDNLMFAKPDRHRIFNCLQQNHFLLTKRNQQPLRAERDTL